MAGNSQGIIENLVLDCWCCPGKSRKCEGLQNLLIIQVFSAGLYEKYFLWRRLMVILLIFFLSLKMNAFFYVHYEMGFCFPLNVIARNGKEICGG